MKICDRTWAREGRAVPATEVVKIGEELFDLCASEAEEVKQFICEPSKESFTDKVSRGLAKGFGKAALTRTPSNPLMKE